MIDAEIKDGKLSASLFMLLRHQRVKKLLRNNFQLSNLIKNTLRGVFLRCVF